MKMINPVKTVKNYFKMIYRDMGVSALDCLYDSLNSMNLVQWYISILCLNYEYWIAVVVYWFKLSIYNMSGGKGKVLTLELVFNKTKSDNLQSIKNLNLWGN